jgi:hypothetical protein
MPSLPLAEIPMSFRDSLPAHAQAFAWLPHQCITLAFLPCGLGHTAFQVKYCQQTRQMAHNVAHYPAYPPHERSRAAMSVTHYTDTSGAFVVPCFCRPLLAPTATTKNPAQVTCQPCLDKMRHYHLLSHSSPTAKESGHERGGT